VAGTIEFGDGTRGMIPSAGSQIWVERYRYLAGGAIGNVLPEEVRLLQKPLNNVVSAVTNPGPGVGGTDEEDIERTKTRAPQSIKNRDRAVTTADFEFLAREASNRVKKVRCLVPSPNEKSPTNVRGRLNRGEGHINVLIVPNSFDLISEVQDHLDSRRMLTTRVHVVAPRNVPVKVTARFHLFPSPAGGAATSSDFENNLTQRIEDAIRAYLDPLSGRPSAPGRKDGEGWEIGQSLFIYELYDHLKPILGRDGYITKMSVNRQFKADTDESEFGRFKLASEVGISLADFEMISAAEIQDIRSDIADGPT
jgi:predicted phage baseplate assembly protein